MKHSYAILLCVALAAGFLASAVPARAAEGWVQEFEDICAKVDIADSLSLDELKTLIERVDRLVPVVEASTDPKKKVYVFRLTKCRGVFEYVVDLKKGG